MKFYINKLLAALISFLVLAGGAAYGADREAKRFLRLTRNERGVPVSLDTSVVTYRKTAGSGKTIEVDLISAIHVGEDHYYQKLNDQFRRYDALLYELILPEGADITAAEPPAGGGSVLSVLQRSLKSALRLEFQLDGIDYGRDNFVHADMTDRQFVASMKSKGESIFSILLQIMIRSQELQKNNAGQSPEIILLKMLMDPGRKFSLKALLAEQFEDLDAITEVIDGPEGSTIISERNKVALAVMEEQIKSGKTSLGIFYGTGHMPDMEKRLINDYGFKMSDLKWFPAWDLTN